MITPTDMQVIRDYNGRPRPTPVVVLGAFDGVHLGHQALLGKARGIGGDCTVVCFEPLPREYFAAQANAAASSKMPESLTPRLCSAAQRLALLHDHGIAQVWQMRFNEPLAATPPADFVRHVIAGRLRSHTVVVGEDYRFGYRGAGDLALLQQLGDDLGFAVKPVAAVLAQGERISSTRIRQALQRGDLSTAAALLGRPYTVCGRVRHGRRLGRDLGYPTLNLSPPGKVLAVNGVIAVRARLSGESQWRAGVANLGTRPTVGGVEPLVEVHLFDYQGNLYGRRVQVQLIEKLRDEAHFPSIDDMVEQMHRDAAQARRILM
ncbi:MAG: bifunctional riboflavin kinase/FAD synthetase [Wenzhouxiangellaceae bacterium]